MKPIVFIPFLLGAIMIHSLLTGCSQAVSDQIEMESDAIDTISEATFTWEPSATQIPSTDTPVLPTDTQIPPTNTPVPPTKRPFPPTKTPVPTITSLPPLIDGLTTNMFESIIYANVNEYASPLDIYAPTDPGPWPVVIVVHGWSQRKGDMTALAQAIASQGAVVYNINVFHTVPLIHSTERIGCSVRFARNTASDYGGDPNLIIILGNSLGAETGVLISMAGNEYSADHCVIKEGEAIPEGFIGYEGVYKLSSQTRYTNLLDHSSLKRENPELYDALDPTAQIGHNLDLQARLVHGYASDAGWWDINPLETKLFYQALVEAGYQNVDLILLDDARHVDLGNNESDSETFTFMVQLVMDFARSLSQ